MAGGNKEVEIKVQVSEEAFRKFLSRAEEHFQKAGKARNVDTYYNHPCRDWMGVEYPYIWFSIRRRGKEILSYKHYFPENSPEKVYCEELETEVDAGTMERILERLGFRKLVTVDKTRTKFIHGKYEIAFDEVAELGYFIEVELIGETDRPEQEKEKMKQFLRENGVSEFSVPDVGYPHLLMRKKGLTSK